jgi:GNAT superfamily N-acetyltransferase
VTVPVIRPATCGDAQFLAWAILTATRSHLAKGWFDVALDQPENSCLDFLQGLTTTTTLSHWHYSRFLIAESHNRPVSALSAFRARDAYPIATAALLETIEAQGISTADAALIWKRGAYMFRCTMRPDDECLVIENLATLASCRGRGYSSALLSHAIERGRAQGRSHAQITLFIGNESAERAYIRAGFRAAKERRDPDFEAVAGAAGLRQYIRDL